MLSITVISSSEEACQYLCVCVREREREREREPRLFVHLCVCLRANVDSDRESEGLDDGRDKEGVREIQQ